MDSLVKMSAILATSGYRYSVQRSLLQKSPNNRALKYRSRYHILWVLKIIEIKNFCELKDLLPAQFEKVCLFSQVLTMINGLLTIA